MQLKIVLLVFALWTYIHPILAQPVPQADWQLAAQYQQKYQEAEAVIDQADCQYEFQADAKSLAPRVQEREVLSLVSLRANNRLSRYKYYDEQSAITKTTATDKGGIRINLGVVYGNYEEENIFYSDAKACQLTLRFGNVGERQLLQTEKSYQDIRYLTSVYFHDVLPIEEKKISFLVPDWLELELKELNFENFQITKKVTPGIRKGHTLYEYTARHLAPLTPEPYARGQSYSYPHLLILAKKFEVRGRITPLIGSSNDLYNWYSSLTKMVRNDPKPIETAVQDILTGKNQH